MNIKAQKAEDNILKIDYNRLLNAAQDQQKHVQHLKLARNHRIFRTQTADKPQSTQSRRFSRVYTHNQHFQNFKQDTSRQEYLQSIYRTSDRQSTGFIRTSVVTTPNLSVSQLRQKSGCLFSTLAIKKSSSVKTVFDPQHLIKVNKTIKQEKKHSNVFPKRKISFQALKHREKHSEDKQVKLEQGKLRQQIVLDILETLETEQNRKTTALGIKKKQKSRKSPKSIYQNQKLSINNRLTVIRLSM